MVHTVRSFLRGRGGKKVFLIHFVASDEFDLYAFLKKEIKKGSSSLTHSHGAIQTVEVHVEHSRLRRILEKIPRSVQVAYEQKEPDR